MNFKSIFLSLLFTLSIPLIAQTSRAYIGLGGTNAIFQDARFTDLKISGNVFRVEVGFDRITQHSYYFLKGHLYAGNNSLPNRPEEKVSLMELNPGIGYMRNLKMKGLYLGIVLDPFNYTIRNNEVLHNNGNFFLMSYDLSLAAKYVKSITNSVKIEIQSEMGVLSLMKYAPSFTANYPQNIIDNSLLSFQDEETRNPLSLQYMTYKTTFNNNYAYLKFNLFAYLGKRLGAGYSWKLRSISDFPQHPLTLANHSFTVRYNIIRKTR